ncbi:MAG: TonB-dependent receptor plug domain-containing protein [Methylotenera sp.]
MQQLNIKKHTIFSSILTPCLLGVVSINASAEHLELPSVEVRAERLYDSGAQSLNTGDTADLLSSHPSVDLYQAGGVSALPSIRGLNDDRIKFTVDGASITSACGNHMNPALSYISPGNVGSFEVYAGITPVSMGGDSIAGTINVASPAINFAPDAEHLLIEGSASTFFRSINNGLSADIKASAANQNLSLGFSGGVDRAQSYEDGHGDKVRSTQFDRRYQNVTLGLIGDVQQFTLRIGHQDIRHQGYPNQRMDMVGNTSDSINANYAQQFDWGKLDTRIFWQQVKHEMGFFSSEKPGTMPMKTDGKDYGYSIKADVPVSQTHLLRLGNDYQRQTLDDFWPPVPLSMMMGPNTFKNINNGKRDRFGLFAEVESKWTPEWTTLLGIRDDYVRTDTGNVQPYNAMGPDNAAAKAFNASDKSKSDNHLDLTATAKYEASTINSIEFGYARKTRSPNLYERYTWGRGHMATAMIGWFGDVNGYVGDIDLKPETANTVSAAFDWHDAAKQDWQFKLTPYYTYVQDYIGAKRIGTMGPMLGSRPILQFDNQDAQFYGIETVGKASLWDSGDFGRGRVTGHLNWTRGERVGNGDDLYHIMPLNARFAIEQNKGAWNNALEVEFVSNKTRVDDARLEPKTAGYGLLNLRSSYQWKQARLDLSANNLLDKYYELPLGGVAYADWKAAGSMGPIGALPGMGRSVNVGLTLNY